MSLIFLIAVFQFSGCYSVQQTGSAGPILDDKPSNTLQEKAEEQGINNPGIVDAELERNRRLWLEKKIVNYNITLTAYQDGNIIPADSVLIEVRGGKGTLIEPTPKVDELRLKVYKHFDTVDKMFDAIQKGVKEGARVEVKYNKECGYPENMTIDYAGVSDGQGGAIISDAATRVTIKKFEIIN